MELRLAVSVRTRVTVSLLEPDAKDSARRKQSVR